jgi:hypothetical protein
MRSNPGGLALLLAAVLAAPAAFGAANIVPPPPPQPVEPPRQPLTFLRPTADGGIGESVTPQNATVARAWRVTPEILALAREPRYTVRMPLGDGRTRDFRPTAFEAREGFTVDEDTGQLVVSDDPSEVSYYWHGENGRDHLALTVAFGRVEGRVYTPAQRLTISTWGREHHYQRIDMGVLNRGVCAHSKIMRHVAALDAERRDGRTESADPVSDQAAGYSANPTIDVARAAKARPAMKGPEPDTELAKHQIKIDVLFYFTDVLAEALDDDSDPSWNYTPGNIAIAEALLGSRTQVYIDEINQSLRNSGGLSHIEFRRKGPVVQLLTRDQFGNDAPYAESPLVSDPYERFAVHLFRLADFENNIISGGSGPPGPRRADHDADLAVLLVSDMGNPAASPPLPLFGVAYMQRTGCGSWGGTQCGVGPGLVGGQFGMFGYSVVSAAPQTANFTFSHEIGHLFGADHDVPFANLIVPPSFAHSFGHRTSTVRDIMADPWCGAWQSDTCPRSQQFSNPEVYFIGTSIPAGTPGGRTCANPAPGACPFTNFTALTFRKNAQGHANIYPVGSNQSEPDLFWDGLEFFCEGPLCPTW